MSRAAPARARAAAPRARPTRVPILGLDSRAQAHKLSFAIHAQAARERGLVRAPVTRWQTKEVLDQEE